MKNIPEELVFIIQEYIPVKCHVCQFICSNNERKPASNI